MHAGDPSPTPDQAASVPPLRRVVATRYVLPLREGGSLPALVEADDQQMYVVKFRGAGQGPKALVAELLIGQLARAAGLRVPELVLIDVEPALGRTEADFEIQALVTASAGQNLALAYLPGSVMFDPAASPEPPAPLPSLIVWLDAFASNVDRTARNPNLLMWQREVWLIDHGAALYWHHDWDPGRDRSADPFALIRDHVLLRWARDLPAADAALVARLHDDVLAAAVAQLPDDLLAGQPPFATPAEHRTGYLDYFRKRRDSSAAFVKEAIDARARRV
jgi:hypothetical protein